MNQTKKILVLCCVLVLFSSLAFAGGFWLWSHLLSPPSFHPSPNATLSLVTEPDDGIAPVLSLINNASSSIDLVMYDLADREVEDALVAAHKRGISVRVLLNKGYYGAQSAMNEPAYAYLVKNGVSVHWTPASFALTHEKSLVVDDKDALIMGFNLTPAYYATSRDFAVRDSDPHDVAALESMFGGDWNGSPLPVSPATDLVWSPHAEDEFVALITSAKHSVLIYNEEMSDVRIINALRDAASRGVSVNVIMTYESSWKSAFLKLTISGVHLHIYPANASLYIHAKMIIVDNSIAFIGSQNFSSASLTSNRELGILITTPAIIRSLDETFASDWTGGGKL